MHTTGVGSALAVFPHWDYQRLPMQGGWVAVAVCEPRGNSGLYERAVVGRALAAAWASGSRGRVVGRTLANPQADAVGLQYKRNRYYDPASGVFTQEDPIGLAGGINLYGFANGDPLNLDDPFGLQFEFMNDPNDTLRKWWTGVQLALQSLSETGNRKEANWARTVLTHIRIAEKSSAVYTFINGKTEAGGRGQALGRTMTIDLERYNKSTKDIVNVGSTMLHEFGHVRYNEWAGDMYNSTVSNVWAIDFENSYRTAIGFPTRDNHHSYPQMK